MNLKSFVKISALLILIFFLAPTAYGEENSHLVLKIGAIQSLTGIASEDGNTTVKALQMGVDEINKIGEMQIELIVEDDATDPAKSVTAYKSLMTKKVDVIIGPTWSFTVNAVLPLVAKDKVVLFNTSTIPECMNLEQSQGFGFTTATSVKEYGKTLSAYLAKNQTKTATIFYTNNTWGEAQLVEYKKVLGDHGVNVLEEISSANFDINDWRAQLPKAKAKNADLWLLLLNKADVDTIIRRAREIGVSSKFFASYHIADALRITSDLQAYEGTCYPYPSAQLASNEYFVSRYRKRYGTNPLVFSDNSYDTLFLIVKAFEKSKRENISLKDALLQTKISGVVGNYSFDEKLSFSGGTADLVCVEGGKSVVK
jgi:branched-chain amino acid transport system substrate-binding protein